jgi:acetolactate synthase I/II/III large subunit
MTVAELVAAFLAAQRVRRLFGLCGGHIQPVWDAADRRAIQVVGVRHEMAAGLMAMGTAELEGGVGVVAVTAGPGFTNALTGVAAAHAARVPLLVLSGVPPRPQLGRGALQELPQAEVARPLCRWSGSVNEPGEALAALEAAWAAARDGGGPAYVDFPTDVLRTAWLGPQPRLLPLLATPALEVGSVDGARALLRAARRPLVISGRAAHRCAAELAAFLEGSGAVHLDTGESRGALAADHPAQVPAVRARALAGADLVITLGRRLDFQLAYGSTAVFASGARFLRIGTTAEETRDNRAPDAEVVGDPGAALEALTGPDGAPANPDRAWLDGLKAASRERQARLAAELASAPPGSDGRLHPYRLLGAVREALPGSWLVVADGGDALSFARVALQPRLDPGALGCIGSGLPFAIAAALASRPALAFTGDGAFGLSALELETAVRLQAPVVVVVANNAGWNIERYDQKVNWAGRLVEVELGDCRYDLLARSLGAHGERVEAPAALLPALRRAFSMPPALVDVAVTRDAVSPDGRAGLARVPDQQALDAWDEAERR